MSIAVWEGVCSFHDAEAAILSKLAAKHNNFDIVRLLLAGIVVLVHAYDLSENSTLAFLPRLLSARLAVEGFFAISGFLIFASYERCSSPRQYFLNRAYRILPGYWLSTIFCLLIAASSGHFHVFGFLFSNLFFLNFLHPGVPGLFLENPGNDALNGALWTIKIEIMFYFSVPILVWCARKWNRNLVLLSIFVGSLLFRSLLANHEKLAIQLPGQLSFFITGALIYYHLEWFKKNGTYLVLAAMALYGVHVWTGWMFLRPAAVSTLILALCLLLPHVVGPTRWGDFSYGTYIFHYPIIQLVVAHRLFQNHCWTALALCLILTAAAAIFSWFVVEKPSLSHSRSRKLRQAARGETGFFPPAIP